MREKTIHRASTGFFMLTVAGILILVNFVAAELFARFDLTESKMYSISEASKNLMKNLPDKVHAKAYFTANLPAPYNSHTSFVKDIFEEYAAYSNGGFGFEFIDPGDNEETRNQLMVLGIPPVQIQEIQNDQFQVKQAWLGIVFYYADKKEVIPVVKTTSGFEYEVTSTIKKLTAERLKTVGFLQGHEEPNPREAMQRASEIIEKNYKIALVDLKEQKASALDEVDTLVIVNPKTKIEEEDLYYIDQFLMKGKTIAFFADAIDVDVRSFRAVNVDNGLAELLTHYGVTINQDLIGDVQNKRINIASQQGMFRISNIINYPLIPVVTDFDKDSPLTQTVDALSFPFLSSLKVTSNTEAVTYTVLARTTPRSWQQVGMFVVNPMENLAPKPDAQTGPFPVAAAAQGRFTSFFANKLDQTAGDKPWLNPSSALTQSPETRILVVGDGSFGLDEYFDPPNVIFLADAVDWLMQDNAMIGIRGRGMENKPIGELEPWEKSVIKYMNMIGIPILFVIFGFARWSMRRARKRGFQLASK
ncbi:MAG: hypothetical protein C4523_15615 [Myxococcales bacterium]|nr:MAG: hypothetical protein C4523_15615 [Myxococcales bacterium]